MIRQINQCVFNSVSVYAKRAFTNLVKMRVRRTMMSLVGLLICIFAAATYAADGPPTPTPVDISPPLMSPSNAAPENTSPSRTYSAGIITVVWSEKNDRVWAYSKDQQSWAEQVIDPPFVGGDGPTSGGHFCWVSHANKVYAYSPKKGLWDLLVFKPGEGEAALRLTETGSGLNCVHDKDTYVFGENGSWSSPTGDACRESKVLENLKWRADIGRLSRNGHSSFCRQLEAGVVERLREQTHDDLVVSFFALRGSPGFISACRITATKRVLPKVQELLVSEDGRRIIENALTKTLEDPENVNPTASSQQEGKTGRSSSATRSKLVPEDDPLDPLGTRVPNRPAAPRDPSPPVSGKPPTKPQAAPAKTAYTKVFATATDIERAQLRDNLVAAQRMKEECEREIAQLERQLAKQRAVVDQISRDPPKSRIAESQVQQTLEGRPEVISLKAKIDALSAEIQKLGNVKQADELRAILEDTKKKLDQNQAELMPIIRQSLKDEAAASLVAEIAGIEAEMEKAQYQLRRAASFAKEYSEKLVELTDAAANPFSPAQPIDAKPLDVAQQELNAAELELQQSQAKAAKADEKQLSAATKDLRAAIAKSFAAQQEVYRAQLRAALAKAGEIDSAISLREKNSQQIINHRLEELTSKTAADGPNTSEGGATLEVVGTGNRADAARNSGSKANDNEAKTDSQLAVYDESTDEGMLRASEPLLRVVRRFNESLSNRSVQDGITESEIIAAARYAAAAKVTPQGDPKELRTNAPDDASLARLLKFVNQGRFPRDSKIHNDPLAVIGGNVASAKIRLVSRKCNLIIRDDKKFVHMTQHNFPRESTQGVTLKNLVEDFLPIAEANNNRRRWGSGGAIVTEDDLFKAITAYEIEYRDKNPPIPFADFERFTQAMDTGVLPKGSTLEFVPSMTLGDYNFTKQGVRLRVPYGADGMNYAFTIYERFVSSEDRSQRVIAFGPEKNGIKAGLFLKGDEHALGPTPEFTIPANSEVELRAGVVYQNTRNEPVRMVVPRLLLADENTVTILSDAGEQTLSFMHGRQSLPTGAAIISIPAGGKYEISASPIWLNCGDKPRLPEPGSEDLRGVAPVEYQPTLYVDRGQTYRLQLRIPKVAANDDTPSFETGSLSFRISDQPAPTKSENTSETSPRRPTY